MDKEIIPNVDYVVRRPNFQHYLKVDAYYGTTHSTGFLNLSSSKIITINNQNPDGLLGFGDKLIGRTVTIRTSAMADIDDRGIERVRLVYYIDDQFSEVMINEYDKPEDFNPVPVFKFKIRFL